MIMGFNLFVAQPRSLVLYSHNCSSQTSAVSSNSPRGRGKGRKKISANDAANRVITLKARISTHEGRKRSLEEENENLTQEIIAKRRTDENG